jgi:hypothetical protein
MSKFNETYTSFLIRMWHEPPTSRASQTVGREWLVQVEHIPGGEKEYFTSLDALFTFISRKLANTSENEKESTI